MTDDVAPDRRLGGWSAFALVVGGMIGSGVFLLPASLARFGWNAVAAWFVVILGALALAWSLSAITRRFSDSGGPAGYMAAAFGPIAGFFMGWSFWLAISTSLAAISSAAASYASMFWPALAAAPVLASLGFIALVTVVNLVGVHWASRFQVLTVVLKLLPLLLVAILAAGLLLAQGSAALHPFPAEGFVPRSVAQAAAIAMFALLGFETVTCMSDRIRNPERTLPRALIGGVLFVGCIYLAVSSALVLMVPEAELAASSAPFADFVATHWAAAPAAFITLFVVISCVGAMNGMSMANGELPRAMARRGMVPAWFGRLNANGTPSRGVLASSLVASGLVLTTTSDTLGGIFTTMALLTTALALWGYLALAVVALKFRLAVPAAVLSVGFILWLFTGIGLKIALLSLALLVVGLPLYRRAPKSVAPAAAE